MTNKFIFRFLGVAALFAAFTFTVTSCGSSATTDGGDSTVTENVDTVKQRENVKVVFNSVPSPVELGQLIERSGATYDKDLLNDINNTSKYTTVTTQGLNLGVYGADLSITSMFDQTQESIIYMKCTSSLSKSLGITTAFNNETMSKMDAAKGNHDSLMSIITDSYYETDDFLKANKRGNVSALMIAGGWVEALYVGSKMAEKTNNTEMMTRIAEMKGSLKSLCALLNMYKGEEGIDPVWAKLQELNKVYESITVSANSELKNTDEKNKTTTLGGDKIAISKEQFKSISKKAEEIRNWIVKP